MKICANSGSPSTAALAEQAAFPFAEKDLAQVGLLLQLETEPSRERGGRLVRSLQRRDVDRGDVFVLEPVGEKIGLLEPDRIELGVAVPVAQRERTVGMRRRRLAVAHEQDRRRARRRREAVLAETFGRRRAHGRKPSGR